MSDLVGTQIVGFLMHSLIFYFRMMTVHKCVVIALILGIDVLFFRTVSATENQCPCAINVRQATADCHYKHDFK